MVQYNKETKQGAHRWTQSLKALADELCLSLITLNDLIWQSAGNSMYYTCFFYGGLAKPNFDGSLSFKVICNIILI